MSNYDFAIAIRAYNRLPGISFPGFSDKFSLIKKSFESLCVSSLGLKIKLFILLDCQKAEESQYSEFFKNKWFEQQKVYPDIEIRKDTNYSSFQWQYEILNNQNHSQLCVFLEDDYFLLPDCLIKIKELFDNYSQVNFVSPYDHLAYYTDWNQVIPHDVICHNNHIWRSVPGTTSTFFTRKSMLTECKTAFKAYHKVLFFPFHATDTMKWLAITHKNIFNPLFFLKCIIYHRYVAWGWFIAWILCWKQILFKKPYNLYVPIPALGTHMIKRELPPLIDWNRLIHGKS